MCDIGDVLPDPGAPIPAEVAESAEFQRALARILGRLPEAWREPFLLHACDGYSLREVADFEGASVADVSWRIDRAREFLRAALAEEYDEAPGATPSEAIFGAIERAEPGPERRAHLVARLARGGKGT